MLCIIHPNTIPFLCVYIFITVASRTDCIMKTTLFLNSVFFFKLVEPLIDGCYSQQENCILIKPRDGNLTCSVQNIPSEYTMNINLDIFADDRSLSLTRINGDHHRHVSGDLTTSCQYTVDEDSTESVIQCTLSGTKNNQFFNSTATARITWQGTVLYLL